MKFIFLSFEIYIVNYDEVIGKKYILNLLSYELLIILEPSVARTCKHITTYLCHIWGWYVVREAPKIYNQSLLKISGPGKNVDFHNQLLNFF